MHERAAEFVERAREEYGVAVDVHEFENGTKTAADAADAIGCDVAQIASSIVVVTDDDPVVVVTSGANRVDLDKVAVYQDATDARMAEADEVKEATGWSIGGVPPICHATDVPVLLDRSLLDHEEVWAAAGTPDAVWPIDPGRLRDLADAEPADVAE
ncbi:YbaK/EbsC family protein [Halobacterium bonnevillei]|uniref:YbaK/EbsC family protein n=1 Tax=Halobacterium bonnevillei TaxID=2692200 RepID=A0A6B0SJJ4_9EURY|nr:YbaK/EbsC family protein [Halobacterium bonnevillei]MXR21868.1 YbaK/EbsC family protein [Halobacterium bonnevillei]